MPVRPSYRGLLLCAEVVSGQNGSASGRVGFEQSIDQSWIFSTGALRLADDFGVLTEKLEVNHDFELYPLTAARRRSRPRRRGGDHDSSRLR